MLPAGYFDMPRDELAALTVDVAREVYRAHFDRLTYFMGRAAAREWLETHRAGDAPCDWILAARSAECTCDHCGGSGVYSWGACVNGRMSHSGDCFRCQGKGLLNFDDMRRCKVYDQMAIARAFR